MTKEETLQMLGGIIRGCIKNNYNYWITDGLTLDTLVSAYNLLGGEDEFSGYTESK